MDINLAEQKRLKAFGQRVKGLRRERSISQEHLAELAGVHRTYIGMIERGEKNITIISAKKVASSLGLTLSELFEGYESEQ